MAEDSRVALGYALGAVAEDAASAVLSSIRKRLNPGTDLTRSADRAKIGTLLVARWFVTGEVASPDEMTYIGEIGSITHQNRNAMAVAVVGLHAWRNFVLKFLDSELVPPGCPAELLDEGRLIVRSTADLDVLMVCRAYDARMAELNAALSFQAQHDSLTGLSNRRLFSDRLEVELAVARRTDRPLCLAAVDLDAFKVYNDSLGHQGGDQLLFGVAKAWLGCIREVDELARVGGDEFLLLLPDCSADDAVAVLRRMHEVVPEGQTCSAGATLWCKNESAEELMARADAALYDAKRKGFGRTVVSVASASTSTRRRRTRTSP